MTWNKLFVTALIVFLVFRGLTFIIATVAASNNPYRDSGDDRLIGRIITILILGLVLGVIAVKISVQDPQYLYQHHWQYPWYTQTKVGLSKIDFFKVWIIITLPASMIEAFIFGVSDDCDEPGDAFVDFGASILIYIGGGLLAMGLGLLLGYLVYGLIWLAYKIFIIVFVVAIGIALSYFLKGVIILNIIGWILSAIFGRKK